MSKRSKFIARFSDGTELQRTTASRVYTHAWLARGARPDPGRLFPDECRADRRWQQHGFSSSPAQCAQNMEAETAFVRRNSAKGFTRDFAEVVPVEKEV